MKTAVLHPYKRALANIEKLLKIKSDKDDALYNRGVVLWKLERLEEALTSYDKLLELKPDDYEVWNIRGILLWTWGHFDEAIASYNKVTEFKPDDAEAFYSKARCYALQGNVEQAIENLQQAINLSSVGGTEVAKADSAFDSIREDERFQALIQEEID